MPFRSAKQRAWMYANKPDMAKRWEAETPPGKLPEKVGGKKNKTKSIRVKDFWKEIGK